MFRIFLFFLAAFALSAPLYAEPAQVTSPEAIEEMDMPDESEEMPKNELSPAQEKAEEKAEEKAKENAPVEKKPGENMEAGFNTVILQGLNKVTARASKIEAVIGSTVRFDTLEIITRSCWKSAPGDQPENAALLEIYEIRQGEPPARIFLGWMFSSSPGLSSLENPTYDITVVKCDKVAKGKL